MHCPSCQFDNPTGVKFCIECGASLKNQCSACGVENLPQAKFCGECGAPLTGKQPAKRKPTSDSRPPVSYTPRHLAERILAEQVALEARGAPDGERKTITALFADIKDSTALIEDLDPEDARRIIDPVLQVMMDAVHRYEGYVAQSLGDGIFALFGAPIAHEDHAHRALYAALLMQEESRKQAERLRFEKGINSRFASASTPARWWCARSVRMISTLITCRLVTPLTSRPAWRAWRRQGRSWSASILTN